MEDEKIIELIKKYAPTGDLLDYIKLKRQDEYIVLYRDDANECTPYIIQQLNSNGLYWGLYYDNSWVAYREFHKLSSIASATIASAKY